MGGWISDLFAWFSTTRKNNGNNRQNNRGNGQNNRENEQNNRGNGQNNRGNGQNNRGNGQNRMSTLKKVPHNFGGPLIPRVPPNNQGNWKKYYNGSPTVRNLSGIFNNENEKHNSNSDNYVLPWNKKKHQLKKVLSHYTNAKRN